MTNGNVEASNPTPFDPTFGIDGKISFYDTVGEENYFSASLKLAKGGYLCAGDLYRYKRGDIGGTWAVKLSEDGEIDNNFGKNGLLKFTPKPEVQDVFHILMGLCETEHHIVFLSYIYTWGSTFDETALAMFRSSKEGILDLAFGDRGVHQIKVPAGTRANSKKTALYAGDLLTQFQKEWATRTSNPVIYENHRITVCFENIAALRVSEEGLLDISFNQTGILAFDNEHGAEVYIAPGSTKGKLLVALGNTIKRYTVEGALDRQFGINGVYTVPLDSVFVALGIDDVDHIVYLALVLGAPGRNYIGQLLNDGRPDPDFNDGSPKELPYYKDRAYAWGGNLALTEPGARYVGVQQLVNTRAWVSYFIRYDQSGAVDTSFGDDGFVLAMTTLTGFYVREPRKLIVFTQRKNESGKESAHAYGLISRP